jgi:hypothetical protein
LRRVSLVGLLSLAVVLASGCGSIAPLSPSPEPATPAPTEEPVVQQSFGEITFRMPASWSVTRPWNSGMFGPELWLTSVAIAGVCERGQFYYPRKSCFASSRKDVAPRLHANETSVLRGEGAVIAFIGRGPVPPPDVVPATPVAFVTGGYHLECKALGGTELTWVVRFNVIDACMQGTVARHKVETIIASIVVVPQG